MRTMDELKPLYLYSSKKRVYVPIDEKDRKKNSAILLLSPSIESSCNMMKLPYIYNPGLYNAFYIDRNVMAYLDNTNENDIDFDEVKEESLSEAMIFSWGKTKFKFNDGIGMMDKNYTEEIFNKKEVSNIIHKLELSKIPEEINIFVHPTIKDLQKDIPTKLIDLYNNKIYSYCKGNEIHVISKRIFDIRDTGCTYEDYLKSELVFSIISQTNPNINYIIAKAISMVIAGIYDWRKENPDEFYDLKIKPLDKACAMIAVVINKKDIRVITKYIKTGDLNLLSKYVVRSTIQTIGSIFKEDTISYFDRQNLLPSEFGIPDKRKYPIHDKDHVKAAIRMFNNCDPDDEKELATNIIKKAKKYGMMDDIKVGAANRFKKYWDKENVKHESTLVDSTEYEKVLSICSKLSPDEFKRISFYDTYRDSKYIIKRIIACNDGKPAGFLDVYHFPSKPDIAQIVIAVDPEYRGLGISDSMVNTLLKSNLQDEYKFSKYYWTAHPDNDASINLAKKHGFIDTDNIDTYGRKVFINKINSDNDLKKDLSKYLNENTEFENVFATDNMVMFTEANNDEANYSKRLKKYLYSERLKNNKEVLLLYDKVKEVVPDVKKTFAKLKMYASKNIYIDLSYYHALFLKNNIYRLDRAVNFYFDFLNRLINNTEINAQYPKQTIFIPIDQGIWPVQPNTELFDYKKNLNPISIIFRLVRTNPQALKSAWGNKHIIFVSSRGYFTVDFKDFNLKKLSRFKLNITKLMSIDQPIEDDYEVDDLNDDYDMTVKNSDSSKAIGLKMIDDIEKKTSIKIDDVSRLNKSPDSISKTHNHLRISSDKILLDKKVIDEPNGIAIIVIDPDGPKGYETIDKSVLKNISNIKSYCIPD